MLFTNQAFFWDPSPVAFTIPFFDFPILWYSLFFATGFLGAYLIVSRLLSQENSDTTTTRHFLDKLSWYLFIGMLIGARLGHVFFYEWPHYKAYPSEILAIWKGGLASHGGAIGLLLALWLFWKTPQNRLPNLSIKKLLDFLSIGAAFAAGCIRIGNFFNQEILGTYTTAWTAIWFGHPAELYAKMPCHPVQLYESAFYFSCCMALWLLKKHLREGALSGLFFVSLFSFRFIIEWVKLPQAFSDSEGLYMGQLLSIPFVFLGAYLLWGAFSKKDNDKKA